MASEIVWTGEMAAAAPCGSPRGMRLQHRGADDPAGHRLPNRVTCSSPHLRNRLVFRLLGVGELERLAVCLADALDGRIRPLVAPQESLLEHATG